jgi:hypothetical protein
MPADLATLENLNTHLLPRQQAFRTNRQVTRVDASLES